MAKRSNSDHIPPQHQSHQPGREDEMSPLPQYAPRYPGTGRLEGKVVLITGGDSGIGRAVSVLFAREGADVAIVYLEETEDAQRTMDLVEAEGGQFLPIAGDVGEEEFCKHAVDLTVDRFGALDILVNNCGEQHPQESLSDISRGQLEKTFKTNVFGYFYMTKAALRHLKPGAAIINTTSVTAYRGSHHLIDYAATRGAIVSFTRSMAQSLANEKIRVNAVAPGPVWTPLIPSSFVSKEVEDFGKGNPMGRPGQPNEVASCHLFLACEDASFMTGQVLHPNGGEAIAS